MKQTRVEKLFGARPNIINIGVRIFYDSLRDQGVKVIHVDWRPPAGGEPDLAALLEKLG